MGRWTRYPAALAVLAALAAAGAVQAQPKPGREPSVAPGGRATLPTGSADWSCHGGRCVYSKPRDQGGARGWSDCTVSWAPTHGGWAPSRYCR